MNCLKIVNDDDVNGNSFWKSIYFTEIQSVRFPMGSGVTGDNMEPGQPMTRPTNI